MNKLREIYYWITEVEIPFWVLVPLQTIAFMVMFFILFGWIIIGSASMGVL